MACPRPVIGSAVGGITYTIKEGETGLLVPPRNPEALANAIAEGAKAEGAEVRLRRAREFVGPGKDVRLCGIKVPSLRL